MTQMRRIECAVCRKGPADGITVYRMNERGQPGLWACNTHKDQFDGRVPDDVRDLVRVIEEAR